MLMLKLAIFAVLVAIAWQDFKFRAVYWWLFVLMPLGLAILGLNHGWKHLVHQAIGNVVFLTFQLLFLTVYFSVKNRSVVNIFKADFGFGDLLFLFGATVYFSTFNYVFYYALSLMCVIGLNLALSVTTAKRNNNNTIPLAGYQSLVLIFFMAFAEVFAFDWRSDNWIINHLHS